MEIIIKPKKILYKNFSEFKGKQIIFLGMRVEDYCDGGYMVNVKIGKFIGELAAGYFKLNFKMKT